MVINLPQTWRFWKSSKFTQQTTFILPPPKKTFKMTFKALIDVEAQPLLTLRLSLDLFHPVFIRGRIWRCLLFRIGWVMYYMYTYIQYLFSFSVFLSLLYQSHLLLYFYVFFSIHSSICLSLIAMFLCIYP